MLVTIAKHDLLGDLFDPVGMNTLGADENAPHLAVDPCPYLLQIGLPDPLGFIVGVADVISY